VYFDRDADISAREAREKRRQELLEKTRAQQKKNDRRPQ
jgi:hypothetical protein